MRFPVMLTIMTTVSVSGAWAEDLPHSTAALTMSVPVECGSGKAVIPGPLSVGVPPHCQPLIQVQALLAASVPTRDDVRAIIRQGDFAKMEQAFKSAWAADQTEPNGPWRTIDLYYAFQDLDPTTNQMSQDWLAAQPDNPYALTARGLQLMQQGWTWRGEGNIGNTWPHRIEKTGELHRQAYHLFQQALEIDPDFLPAADGLIALTPTVGDRSDMLIVLEHVMQTHPNHASLMWAMDALSPQWGGTQDQVDLICARYAPLIPTDIPYDAETCTIEAAYEAPYTDGPRFQAARSALLKSTTPWLDWPRQQEMMISDAAPDQKLAALRKVETKRPLDLGEARLLDDLVTQVTGQPPKPDEAALPKAARYWVKEYRRRATNAPLAPSALQHLIAAINTEQQVDGMEFPREEIRDRALRVLSAYPEDPEIWKIAADLIAELGTAPGQDEVTRLALAEPYYDNAIAYSMHDTNVLSAAVDPKLRLLAKQWLFEGTGAVPPLNVPAGMDESLICPTIRQLKLLALICTANGQAGQSCAEWEAQMNDDLKLSDYAKAGHCAAEFTPQLTADILYSPVSVHLSPSK